MPILRGSSRLDSPKSKDASPAQENKRETRSSKSTTQCASSRLKEFKTSSKLTRAELRTAASARLAQRNKKKAEKDTNIIVEEQTIRIKTEEKSPHSSKKGSPSKECKTSDGVELRSKKSANETQDKEILTEEPRRKSCREKLGQSSTSDDSQSEDKGSSHHKRKQSLEEKEESATAKKKLRHSFFEYVLEAVPNEAKNTEQLEEEVDESLGGRRRSKRGSIPNTLYFKNFIDPSKRIPKASDVKSKLMGLKGKLSVEEKDTDERQKKRHETATKPTFNKDKIEIIKWDTDLIVEPRDKSNSESNRSDTEVAGRTEQVQENTQADVPDSAENKDGQDDDSPTSQTQADREPSCEKETDTKIREFFTELSQQKDLTTDVEITKMSVVYINNKSSADSMDNVKKASQNVDSRETEAKTDEREVEGIEIDYNTTESCIEIQGVTEEVNEIVEGTDDVAEIEEVSRSVPIREYPGRICKQEEMEDEDEGNYITEMYIQDDNSTQIRISEAVEKTDEGDVKSQSGQQKEKMAPVQKTDISVQADEFSDNESQDESPLEKDATDNALTVKSSTTEIKKSSTIITMPDGRSLTVTSTDKSPFTFRTVPKPTITKQVSSSTPNTDIRRVTLPSGPTGLKMLNITPEPVRKTKATVLSPDGEAIPGETEGVVIEAVQKSQDGWNGVYKSQGLGTDNQEVILVSLPEGQEVKQRFPIRPKRLDDVSFEVTEEGEYVCGVCNYKTNRKSNWYKHRKKHMGQKTHKCEYCNYVAATSSNLKRHQNIHLDVREHQCNQCGQTFRQKIHLERHIKYKHEEKSVKCPLCDYVCANENPDLKVHIKRRHIPQEDEEGKEAKSYSCEECGLMTYNKKDMRQHMKFHKNGPELKLFCEQCSFVTDCESRLKRHVLIHSHERPFQCGLCDYRGSQKEHVLRHMKTQHQIYVEKRSKKGLEMEDSDSKDSSSVDKQPDRSDYSSQEKIFACNHCSMKFSKLINLYKHLHGQHKEVLPQDSEEFLCVVCDFRTSSKKNLLVHMRKHNLQDQVPPSHVYSCVLCRYMNPRRRNLFQHMKKKHGIEIVIRDDGSTSCFVTESLPTNEDSMNNILTVGDVVTTTASEETPQLQIVTDDSNSAQNIISIEDLAYAVSHPKPNTQIVKESTPKPRIATVVKEHEAAEAIEGLQALAGQPGITQFTIDPQKQDIMETEVITMENPVEFVEDKEAEKDSGYQLSTDQLMSLSTGDFVEINGEMYKVEISTEDNTPSTAADTPSTASIGPTEVGLPVNEGPQTSTNELLLSEISTDQLENSLIKVVSTPVDNTQTVNTPISDSSQAALITRIREHAIKVSLVDSGEVEEMEVPTRADSAETEKGEISEPTVNSREIPQAKSQEGDVESMADGQNKTSTIEEVLMQVENAANLATTDASAGETTEGMMTSDMLGMQQNEPISTQPPFTPVDHKNMEKMEDIVQNEPPVSQEMMEVSDIAELTSPVSDNPGDRNNVNEMTNPVYLQQDVDVNVSIEKSDSDTMTTSS